MDTVVLQQNINTHKESSLMLSNTETAEEPFKDAAGEIKSVLVLTESSAEVLIRPHVDTDKPL